MGSHELPRSDVPFSAGLPAPLTETVETSVSVLLARISDLTARLEKAERQIRENELRSLGQDVTEATRSAEELRAANAELARSNAELEQFAALIAHDLSAPLVSLSGGAVLLREEAGATLSEEGRELVGYIEEGAQQLGRLVHGLLQYSRAGHGHLRANSCSMEEVLASVLKRLRADLERTGARVTWDRLPVVHGDADLLGQLVQNLIENALKYSHDRTPEVHVGAHEEPGGWVFSVRDNGIGIAVEHFERIFHLFERVHMDDLKCSGLGMGLATCKRIVEKHDGRIWVESTPRAGSTFLFTLPGAQRG